MRFFLLGSAAALIGLGACGDEVMGGPFYGQEPDASPNVPPFGTSRDGGSVSDDSSVPGDSSIPGDSSVPGDSSAPGDGGPIVPVNGQSSETVIAVLPQLNDKLLFVARQADHTGAVLFRTDKNGQLDPTYADGGRTLALGTFAYNAAQESNGGIVIAGAEGLIRVDANGKQDKTFVNLHDYQDALAIQPDGKIVGAAWNAGSGKLRVQRFLATGDLDSTFGTSGTVETQFPNGAVLGHAVVIDGQNRILVAGQFDTTPKAQFGIARYDATGKLDTTFGSGGLVATTFGEHSRAARMTLDANGKIVVTGTTSNSSNQPVAIAIARFDGATGAPDGTFGTNGQVSYPVTSADYRGRVTGLVQRPNGKIVVGTAAGLYQFTSAGALDTGPFSVHTLSLPKLPTQEVISLMPDGAIVGGGSIAIDTFHQSSAAWRVDASGQLDTSLAASNGGELLVPFTATRDHIRGLYVRADGSIDAAGFGAGAGVVAHYTANGQLDPSFGTGGFVYYKDDQAWGIIDDTAGRLLVNVGFRIQALTPSGAADPSYSYSTGNAFGGDWFSTQGLALDGSGKLIIAGYAGGSRSEHLGVGRFLTTGEVDTTFGTQGAYVRATNGERAYAAALQTDGKIVVVGDSENPQQGTKGDLFIARLTTAGVMDPSFVGDTGTSAGLVKIDVTPKAFEAGFAVGVQSDGKIVVAGAAGDDYGLHYDFDASPTHDLFVVRVGTDGKLDPSFGAGGIVKGYPGAEARSMIMRPDGKIVVAGRRATAKAKIDFVAWRFMPNGTLDATFGTGGEYVAPFTDDAAAFTIGAQVSGSLVFGGYAMNGVTGHDLALIRY